MPKHRELVKDYNGEYRGVTYRLRMWEERGVNGSDARYVKVEADPVGRTKWREGLHERTFGKWIPYLRSEPRSKEEHIEKVMSSFKSKVDEYREFQEEVEERN